jgi:hypothetical protein
VQNFRHWFFCSPSKYSSLLHNGDTNGEVTGFVVGFETGVSVGDTVGAVVGVGSLATLNVIDSVVLALPLALVCSYAIAEIVCDPSSFRSAHPRNFPFLSPQRDHGAAFSIRPSMRTDLTEPAVTASTARTDLREDAR